ncbi:hypothetical protein ACIA8K_11550 [Catenuloplanes sp. NPDC051500]|uniref:hypothetical protein n=1 Tax=Catenuloplanes sp. NPDC051500 TaxID=3363959 RepID=UPI00378F1C59
MQNPRRRMIAPLLAATVLAPALAFAAPAQAAAAPAPARAAAFAATPDWQPASVRLTSWKLSKTAYTVRSSDPCAVRAHVSAVLSGPMPTENVFVSAVGADFYLGGEIGGYTVLENSGGNTWDGDVTVCGADPAGTYRMELYGAYATGTGLDDPDFAVYRTNVVTTTFTVKRPATVTLNATPEPVKKGAKLTAKGTLTSDGRKLANTKVQVWFKADGANAWTLAGSAKTNASGAYTATFTAKASGTWKAVVPATGTRNETVAYDAVKVKK